MDTSKKDQHYTRLFLIRHGDTLDEETKKIYKGSIDVPLSARGVTRMEQVARFMTRYRLDALYTSGLSRCIRSGAIIADAQNLKTSLDTGFNEVGFGKWEGLSFDEIRERYPQLFHAWLKNPLGHTPPDGEPLLSAQTRAMGALWRIVEDHRNEVVAVVCHAGVLKIILATLISLDLLRMHGLAQDYGCVDIVDIYDDGNAVIKLLNYTVDIQNNLSNDPMRIA